MNPSGHLPPRRRESEAGVFRVKCDDVQGVLFDYATGELGESRTELVREHLRGCSKCQAALADVRATLDILHDASQDGPPIPQQLSEKHRKRIIWALAHPLLDWVYRHHLLVSVLAAFVVVAVVLGILRGAGVWKPEQPEPAGPTIIIRPMPAGFAGTNSPSP